MKKKQDWEQITANFLLENKNKGFAWGKWDCCRFVNAYIYAVTGLNAIPSGLDWKDQKSALQAISKLGNNFPETINNVFKELKLEKIKKNFAQFGDIILFKEQEHLLGIYDGTFIHGVTDNGLQTKSIDLAKNIWRING